MSEEPSVVLGDGNQAWTGDYVKCRVDHYSSVHKGQNRRIQRIEDGCIVLNNNGSPYGTSPYRPYNFTLAGRHHPNHKQEKTTVFHIAIRIIEGQNWTELANRINQIGRGDARGYPFEDQVMADTSADALKERIRARLSTRPMEHWLICSGNTIGERADPPVRFRSI